MKWLAILCLMGLLLLARECVAQTGRYAPYDASYITLEKEKALTNETALDESGTGFLHFDDSTNTFTIRDVDTSDLITSCSAGELIYSDGSAMQCSTGLTWDGSGPKKLSIGTAPHAPMGNVDGFWVSTETAVPSVVMTEYCTGGFGGCFGPGFVGARARGTGSSPAAVMSGDILLNIFAHGYDGGSWLAAGGVIVKASEDWSASAGGSTLQVWLNPNGSRTFTVVHEVTGQDATFHVPVRLDGVASCDIVTDAAGELQCGYIAHATNHEGGGVDPITAENLTSSCAAGDFLAPDGGGGLACGYVAHASHHEEGGDDPLAAENLTSSCAAGDFLAPNGAGGIDCGYVSHASKHIKGGSDTIKAEDLASSCTSTDFIAPDGAGGVSCGYVTHGSHHQQGGSDALNVEDLASTCSAGQVLVPDGAGGVACQSEKKMIGLTGGGLVPDGTVCTGPTQKTINGKRMWAVNCSDTTGGDVQVAVPMPQRWDEGPVEIRVAAVKESTAAATLAFDVSAACSVDGAFDTAADVDTSLSTANQEEYSTYVTVTPGGTCMDGDTLWVKMALDDATSSAISDVYVTGVQVRYAVAAATD